MQTEKALFRSERTSSGTVFVLSGEWNVATLQQVEKPARKAVFESAGKAGIVTFDCSELSRLDTIGALFINVLAAELRAAIPGSGKNALTIDFKGADERQQALLAIARPPKQNDAPTAAVNPLLRLPLSLGKAICAGAENVPALTAFFGRFLANLGGLILRPREMRWTSLVFHMEQTGLKAVPIVALLTFLIGVVVAYMGSQQLEKFGAQVFAVNLLEVSVMREMAVLITAVVVAGRSSSSFTAQIGSMVSNEEVAALRSMGMDPMTLLVVPRVSALIITLPMLVFLADISALLGGATALGLTMDLSLQSFIIQFHSIANVRNFLVGMVKTPFFALVIGLVGCFQGFQATGSAESVGFLTTVAVVRSIFLVILLDALFALFFMILGI